MKKILAMLVVVMTLTITATAQRATTMPVASADTLSNTDTTSKVIMATAGYSGVVIQPIVTRLSGTAAGKVYLYESLDGTNYGSAVDSLTLSNQVTNTGLWKRIPPHPVYYKVTGISSGTVSQVLTVKYVMRKHD